MGCGAGLIGITALTLGASKVVFQDFNADVLTYFTLSNLLLHERSSGERFFGKCQFVSGDWSDVAKLLAKQTEKFDAIFTSETIYSEDNYAKLIEVFKAALAANGSVFVAGKVHYFGVGKSLCVCVCVVVSGRLTALISGGGMRSFEEFIAQDNCLKSTVHTVIDASVQREILQIAHRE